MISSCFVSSWANPDIAQTRHTFEFSNYEESNFTETAWNSVLDQGDDYVWQEDNLMETNSMPQQMISAVTDGCCEKIRIGFNDTDASAKHADRIGVYVLATSNHNNKAEYHQEGGQNIVYFYKNLGWYIGGDYDTSGIQSTSAANCPVQQRLWRYWTGEEWRELEEGKVRAI